MWKNPSLILYQGLRKRPPALQTLPSVGSTLSCPLHLGHSGQNIPKFICNQTSGWLTQLEPHTCQPCERLFTRMRWNPIKERRIRAAARSIWVQITARYSRHFRTTHLIIRSRHQRRSFPSELGTLNLFLIRLYLAHQFNFLSIYSRCTLLAVMSLKQFHREETTDESTITFTWNVNYISRLKLIGNQGFFLPIFHLLLRRHKHALSRLPSVPSDVGFTLWQLL